MTIAISWHAILLATIAALPNDGTDSAARYEAAVAAYRAGQWAAAGESFRQIAISNSNTAPYSWFGFGNACVQQAASQGTSPQAARAHLDEAIQAYRTVLNGPVPRPLHLDDVRHNLELAKRLRYEIERGTPGSSKAPPTATEKAAARRSPAPDGTERRDAGPLPTESDLSARPIQKDEGAVPKPAPGLPLVDPGPLTRVDAEARLSAALERLKAGARDRHEQSQPRRVGIPGDY